MWGAAVLVGGVTIGVPPRSSACACRSFCLCVEHACTGKRTRLRWTQTCQHGLPMLLLFFTQWGTLSRCRLDLAVFACVACGGVQGPVCVCHFFKKSLLFPGSVLAALPSSLLPWRVAGTECFLRLID